MDTRIHCNCLGSSRPRLVASNAYPLFSVPIFSLYFQSAEMATQGWACTFFSITITIQWCIIVKNKQTESHQIGDIALDNNTECMIRATWTTISLWTSLRQQQNKRVFRLALQKTQRGSSLQPTVQQSSPSSSLAGEFALSTTLEWTAEPFSPLRVCH